MADNHALFKLNSYLKDFSILANSSRVKVREKNWRLLVLLVSVWPSDFLYVVQ